MDQVGFDDSSFSGREGEGASCCPVLAST